MWFIRYANEETGDRCHVKILDLNLSKLPAGFFREAFYYKPLSSTPSFGPWYSKQVIGHNTLATMTKVMTTEAGLPVRTDHALRATSATRLFQAGVPEHVIQGRTGHKTLQALRQYREPSELQQMAACKVLDNGHGHTDHTDAKVKESGETTEQADELKVVEVEQPSETGRQNPAPFVISDCVFTNCSTVNISIGKE